MCTVKVTNDYSIGIMGIDRYISNLTAEKLRSLLRIELRDPDAHALSSITSPDERRIISYIAAFCRRESLPRPVSRRFVGHILYSQLREPS